MSLRPAAAGTSYELVALAARPYDVPGSPVGTSYELVAPAATPYDVPWLASGREPLPACGYQRILDLIEERLRLGSQPEHR